MAFKQITWPWLAGLFAGVALFMGEALGQSAALPAANSPHANFIATLKTLKSKDGSGKRPKYVLLGDSDHSAPEIREVLSDDNVLQAAKDLGYDVLVQEAGVEQNRGYDAPKIAANPVKLASAVEMLRKQFSFPAKPAETVSPVLDQKTQDGLAALVGLLYRAKSPSKFDAGPLTERIVENLENTLAAGADEQLLAQVRPFVEALRYVKDTGNAPVFPTLATDFDDICQGRRKMEDLAAETVSPYNRENAGRAARLIRSNIGILSSACHAGVALYYPDEDLAPADLETENNADFIDGLFTGDAVFDLVRFDAELRASAEPQKLQDKVSARDNHRMEAQVNNKIAANIRAYVGDRQAIILYGRNHNKYLVEALGRAQTTIIDIVADRNSVEIGTLPGGVAEENRMFPDHFYKAANDDMAAVTDAASRREFRSHTLNFLTRAQYDRAIGALPAALKPYALPYVDYDRNSRNDVYPAPPAKQAAPH